MSERQAIKLALQKQDWITEHLKPVHNFNDNSLIGRGGRVQVQLTTSEPKVRLHGYNVKVLLNDWSDLESQSVQKKIRQAAEKSLKKQANQLLPQRLEDLSRRCALEYRSVSVRKLKSRWGSCDQHKNIVLNIFLIQLSWELIDYVIIHELVHTKHPHHQADFWRAVEEHLPNYAALRKQLKEHSTIAQPQ